MQGTQSRSEWTVTPQQLAIRVFVFAAAYFLAAESVNLMKANTDFYAPFWPACGLFLAVLLTNPRKSWWIFLLAGYTANLLSSFIHQPPALIVIGYPAGDVIEAVIAASLILKARRRWPLESSFAAGLLALVGAVTAATAINAALCATVIHSFDPQKQFMIHWFQWWSGDTIGILVVTPLILFWRDFSIAASLHGNYKSKYRSILIVIACVAVWLTVFMSPDHWLFSQKAITTLFLVAAALWLSPRTFVVLGFLYAYLAFFAAMHIHPTLLPESGNAGTELYVVQVYVTIGLSLSYVILLLNRQRERTEQELRGKEARLKEAQFLAQIGNWELDLVHNRLSLSDEMYRIFEMDPDKAGATFDTFFEAVHPDDRELVKEAFAASVHQHAPYELTHRLKMADDRIKFVHETCKTDFSPEGTPLRSVGTVQDITERKRVEDSLRQREDLHRLLVENALFPIVISSLDDKKVLFANELARRFFEVSGPAEGLNAPDFWFNPADREREIVVLKEGGAITEAEVTVLTANGRVKCVLRSTTLLNYGGLPAKITIYVDVTERKAAEAALRESEERYREIIEGQGEGVAITDFDDVFLYSNPAADEIFGVARGGLAGHPVSEFVSISKLEFIEEHTAARKAGHKSSYEIEIHRPDGGIRTIQLTATPRKDNNGAIIGTFGIFRDVTDLRKVEEERRIFFERYRAMLGTTTDGFWQNNFDGRFLDVNDAYCRMSGYSREELLRMSIADIEAQESTQDVLDHLVRLKDVATEHFESLHRAKDGRVYPVEISVTRLEDSNVLMVFVRDVTDRKNAESSLRNSHAQLRQLTAHIESVREEERRWIAREVHDELGQVITAMRYDLAWLKKRLPADPSVLTDKADGMDVLLQSAMQSVKKISSRLRPVPVEQMGMENALEWLIQDFAQRSNVVCLWTVDIKECDIDAELGTAVYRILQETLTNIVRHSQATQVKIHLTCQDKSIILQVDDNGVGFDPVVIDGRKSFGLMGIRERVQFFGGSFEIRSHPGSGTTLYAAIPLSIPGADHDTNSDRG